MLKMSESGLQDIFSACKCNDSRMEKHVPSFINYSLLFVFVVGEKSNHPLSPDFVPSVFTHITSPKKRRAEQSLVSFNRRQELKQRKQDAERQTTAVSALLDLCKSAAVSTSVDNVAAFYVGDNDVIDTPVIDNNINPATDFMVATPVDNNIDDGTGGTVATPAVSLNLDPATGFMVATPVENNIDEGTGGMVDTPANNIDDAAMDDSISEGDQSRLDDELLQLMSADCDILRQENRELRTQLNRGSLEEDGFRDDNDKVLFFTGIPSFMIMTTVFAMVIPFVNAARKLSPFQMCLLTCMRMRKNLSIRFLGYLFGVSQSSASRIFYDVLTVMHTRLVPLLILWPERDILKMSMPMSFRSKFGKCACIIDCFEVFIERPSDVKARAQTYSTYKSHNTMTFLIGITPQGSISFISKGWGGGGRTSDKHLTENCGFLNHLLPGDLILADRGFNIAETLGSCSASLKIPAFTKGRSQLSALDVESTRGLAAVRIHVERVIGMTRQKYTMLGSTIPNTLCVADSTGLTTLDKIVQVASALTNLSPPIVAFD